jgi:hypothetical protein
MSPPHMTNPKEVHTDHLAQDVARWENKGGAPSQSKSDKAMSWFVPPLVIPAFLVVLIVARIAYVTSL